MISVRDMVKSLLQGVCSAVWYFYPQSWVQLPCISWRESGSRELAQADGREHLTELEYTVDVWAKYPEQTHALAERIDEAFASVRLRRDYAADLFQSGVHHRVLRYRCVADAQGRIYQ